MSIITENRAGLLTRRQVLATAFQFGFLKPRTHNEPAPKFSLGQHVYSEFLSDESGLLVYVGRIVGYVLNPDWGHIPGWWYFVRWSISDSQVMTEPRFDEVPEAELVPINFRWGWVQK